jgi:hypothetical protein
MEQNKVYYSGEQWGQCQFCGAITDVRESFCFGCAEAQTIIGTGVDMYDRITKEDPIWSHPDGDGIRLPIEQTNRRLKLLIASGWRPPQKNNEKLDKADNSENEIHGTDLDPYSLLR